MPKPPVAVLFTSADLTSTGTAGVGYSPPAGLAPTYDAAARHYVRLLIERPPTPGFEAAAAALENRPPTLSFSGFVQQNLTDTVVAEYTQKYKGVAIYGQPVGVEMEHSTKFVAFGGALGVPVNLDPIASISPRQALSTARAIAGLESYQALPDLEAPQLVFRFDPGRQEWNLVYVFEGVPVKDTATHAHDATRKDAGPALHEHDGTGQLFNIYRLFIDAHSGLEVARVALRKNAQVAIDYVDPVLGTTLRINAENDDSAPGNYSLYDSARKIRTMSLGFDDLNCGPMELPGLPVETNTVTAGVPAFANRAAIVAHHRAAAVYDFFSSVLKRNSIDGNGMEIVSVVDCADYRHNGFSCGPRNPVKKDWKNAAWIRDTRPIAGPALQSGLMVYGQTKWTTDGQYHSFAESLDVVGHELTHGITDYTSNLEYVTESGALNESYSDIIGIAISNAGENNVNNWNWLLGEDLTSDRTPTRNLQDPHLGHADFQFAYKNQPAHMSEFLELSPNEPPSRYNDNGYVHYNSGIHNKAAYNLFASGAFTWQEVVQMYYMTLTTAGRLSRLATFRDSRDGMVASCKTLFRNLAVAAINLRVAAVTKAFSDVGIE